MKRTKYLEKLLKLKDLHIIKVITGIRRCGKSTLLSQFQEELLEKGVKSNQIISINLEALEFEDLLEYHALYNYIVDKINSNYMNYIFIDEIQIVPEFQKALDSLFIRKNVDLYVTGSNAMILSGELATRLSGRYIEFNILPFSFSEYIEDKGITDLNLGIKGYMRDGGFPFAISLNDREVYTEYMRGIYNSVLVKDIINRLGSSNIDVIDSVLRYICDTVGNLITPKKIADTLTSMNRKTNSTSVEKYLTAMENSYLFYKVRRYNISGKQWLVRQCKYYLTDLGIRSLFKEFNSNDTGHLLENIVAIELIRRSYSIGVGVLGDKEVDFVVTKDDEFSYIQVAWSVVDENVLKREITPLLNIKDNYPKYLLTMDPLPFDVKGIHHINIVEWLNER
ncbi:MAG: ATP-binding protein [Lachnospiraceae bacterium]|jgi:predicted AAA+ superfamily ATPase|nr:ATP-binding protein [Lachnospiraceae bacterium]